MTAKPPVLKYPARCSSSAQVGDPRPPGSAQRAPGDPAIRVEVLGALRITTGDREIEGGLRKARELLAFLAVHPAGPAGRRSARRCGPTRLPATVPASAASRCASSATCSAPPPACHPCLRRQLGPSLIVIVPLILGGPVSIASLSVLEILRLRRNGDFPFLEGPPQALPAPAVDPRRRGHAGAR